MRLEEALVNDVDNYEQSQSVAGPSEIAVVVLKLEHELLFGKFGGEPVAKICQHRIPDAGAKHGEQRELQEVHPCKSGRDGNELAYGRNQSTKECGDCPMLVEIFFGFFNLFGINEAHVAKAAVGKAVDDGAADPKRQHVVDHSTDKCTNGGE